MRRGLSIAALAACVALSGCAAQTTPDITIAPCTMQHIPAHTRTDVCVAPNGALVPTLDYKLGMVAGSHVPSELVKP